MAITTSSSTSVKPLLDLRVEKEDIKNLLRWEWPKKTECEMETIQMLPHRRRRTEITKSEQNNASLPSSGKKPKIFFQGTADFLPQATSKAA